jgi:hypothetical protein
LEKGFAILLNVPANLDAVFGRDDLLQSFSSLHNTLAGDVAAIRPKQVEKKINDRRGRTFLPLLEQLETRNSFARQR